MKSILIFLLVGCNFIGYAQNCHREYLEPNVAWKKYSHVVQSHGVWNYHYLLKEGKIDTVKVYYKYKEDDCRFMGKIVYGENGKVKYEIEVFDVNIGAMNDTLERYDDDGHNVGHKIITYVYDNNDRLIERYAPADIKAKLTDGWIEKFTYNKNGTVKTRTYTHLFYEEVRIETSTFKYDNCRNISEVRTSLNPEEEFPVIRLEMPPLYELEEFEYTYNEDCIWTEKYSIANGERQLRSKRILELKP